jgi:thioredoxin reductase (NADPH)
MAKPVLMTVDDDPEVLGAIDRDLRAHYGNHYRIVKVATAVDAVETARRLKERGTPVAMFIVDQRMPTMTGTQVLAEVLKIHPDSKKVLLTAYADTEAAITSINDIGLDHYLMKPWDPPEEKLYPVLDDLLGEWSARVRLPFEGIRLAGARWSPESYTAKEFLSRNQVPYLWIDVDQDTPMRELISSLPEGIGGLPVVIMPDGERLVNPSLPLLAERVGLHTRASLPFYDLVVIGGGPAGLANALYGATEGLKTLMIEQNAPGGQAATSSRIENYLGFPSGITGADLAQRATAQVRRFGVEILTATEVVGIRRADPYRIVSMADGSEVSCYAAVFTTGMKVRKLEVPGIEPLLGIGVYYGAAMTEGLTYRDQDVCIVGGANSAGQAALFFSRYARRVSMMVRAQSLSPAMSRYLVDRIGAAPNIEVLNGVEVASVSGSGRLESVVVREIETGAERRVDSAAMFIFIGTAPHTEMVQGTLELDEKGYVLTGPDLPRTVRGIRGWNLDRDPYLFETNTPGVFAAGDVRSGANRRVAAAVGEGSAAIHSVLRYLQTV